MHLSEGGHFSGTSEEIEEEINLPSQRLPGNGLRRSNTPDAMPELIRELHKMQGMTQAEPGQAIGYPAPVIGNIEQGQ